MKFHNFVKRDLCIAFKNPKKVGEMMSLEKCTCHGGCGGGISARQEIYVKYFEFDNNNGFIPGKQFYIQNINSIHPTYLTVSTEGAYLQSSQRYIKTETGKAPGVNGIFSWDSNSKCLRNKRYQSCIGFAQQGDSYQLVALGDAEAMSHTLTDIKFDGQFLWLNDRVVQPQAGYSYTQGMTVSLGSLNGHEWQQWKLVSQERTMVGMTLTNPIDNRKNNAFKSKAFFTLNLYNGLALTVDKNGNVKADVNSKANSANQFFVDDKTRALTHKDTGLALKAEMINGKLILKGRKFEDSSSFFFSRPGSQGIVQMSANKDYVWKFNTVKNQIDIVKGDGSKSWSTSGTFFKQNIVGKKSLAQTDELVQTTTQMAEALNESEIAH